MGAFGTNPLVLTLAFVLELAGLAALSLWGWQTGSGWLRFILAAGIPLLAAAAWGVFRVPGDVGRGLVAVPGRVRLLLELDFYAIAVWAIFNRGYTAAGWIFAALVIIRYAASFDRVLWLLRK
jgi:hypothetical protein